MFKFVPISLVFSSLFLHFGGQAKEKAAKSALEKSVFPRFQSKARRDFYKKEIEALCAKQKCLEEQKKFPAVQLLNDPDLFFRFEIPSWGESKGKLHKGQILSRHDLKTLTGSEIDAAATLNFVSRLVSKGKEQAGRLFEIRSTPFGDGIMSLSFNAAVLDKDYTINLLLYPPTFEGVKEDLGLKKVLVAPVLQNDILVAEDSPANRTRLREAIPKLRKLNDERFWASQKVYVFTGKDFAETD